MSDLVRSDVDAMSNLKGAVVTSGHKYANEAENLRKTAARFDDASEAATHAHAAEVARELAARLDALGSEFETVSVGLIGEIERLSALVEVNARGRR